VVLLCGLEVACVPPGGPPGEDAGGGEKAGYLTDLPEGWRMRCLEPELANRLPGCSAIDQASGADAERLAFELNLEASDQDIFPPGLGELHFAHGRFAGWTARDLATALADPDAYDVDPADLDDLSVAVNRAFVERFDRYYAAVGPYVQVVNVNDDLGTQNAPMLSPDLFAEAIAPHYRRFADWLHADTNWQLYLHSCGAIEPLIETLIDVGVDILNPIQTSAAGMDPTELKRKYGGRIVFWGGGCDTQSVLGFRSPEEIADHVRDRIRVFAPGGGFVFNQVHVIQPNVPPEHICAMFDTARQCGTYPIR